MKLVPFQADTHAQAWDGFARQHGTFFHLSGWQQVIKNTYRFPSAYYFWEQDGSIAGLLPAFVVSRPFAGRALISNPFAISAGPLIRETTQTDETFEAIETLARDLGVDYVELRDTRPPTAPRFQNWQSNVQFATFEKRLGASHDDNFMAIPNRQRAVIRKASNFDLVFESHQDIDRFLSVYSVSLRNLGTPIYPRRYFLSLLQQFPERVLLTSVSHEARDLTTVLSFKFNDRLMPYYGGGIPAARDFNSFPWMYWELMKLGVEMEHPVFDFGRSPIDSGAYQFKKNLGFEPRAMTYSFLSVNGSPPDLSPSSKLAQKLTATWRYLPLPLTKIIGPVGAVYAV